MYYLFLAFMMMDRQKIGALLQLIQPSVIPNSVKSSNAQNNADSIIDLLGLNFVAWYGSGCNDNANYAIARLQRPSI